MQGAVDDLPVGRVVERLGELAGDAHGLHCRGRPVLAHDDVEGVGGGEILREVGAVAVDAGCPRRGNHRMLQLRRDQLFEFGDELVNAFRGKVEAEEFDGDETIAILIKCAKDRAQRAIADLMQYTKRTEGVGRRGAGSFRVQSRLLS